MFSFLFVRTKNINLNRSYLQRILQSESKGMKVLYSAKIRLIPKASNGHLNLKWQNSIILHVYCKLNLLSPF